MQSKIVYACLRLATSTSSISRRSTTRTSTSPKTSSTRRPESISSRDFSAQPFLGVLRNVSTGQILLHGEASRLQYLANEIDFAIIHSIRMTCRLAATPTTILEGRRAQCALLDVTSRARAHAFTPCSRMTSHTIRRPTERNETSTLGVVGLFTSHRRLK